MPRYFPKKGDFISVTFNPQSGREQKSRRPALVVSNDLFNRRTGMAIVCPVTNTDRRIPFHVPIPESSGLTGFVMAEQVKSIDFASRKARHIAAAPTEVLEAVLGILDAVLY